MDGNLTCSQTHSKLTGFELKKSSIAWFGSLGGSNYHRETPGRPNYPDPPLIECKKREECLIPKGADAIAVVLFPQHLGTPNLSKHCSCTALDSPLIMTCATLIVGELTNRAMQQPNQQSKWIDVLFHQSVISIPNPLPWQQESGA